MKVFIKVLQVIGMCYAFTVFLIFFFLLFPFVFIASFFGRVSGGNMIYRICRFWADVVLPLDFIYHKNIYEAEFDQTHPAVYVFNHLSYLDIPIIFKAIRKQNFRILGKAEMARIPLFGYLYRNAVVMVERDNAVSRARSVRSLISILSRNISVVVSPEGSFNTSGKPLKEFYDGAFRLAIETKTPIRPLLFLDCYKRMNPSSFFNISIGRCRVVHLDEIPVEGLTIRDVPVLRQKVHAVMEEGLRRYKAEWIVEDNISY